MRHPLRAGLVISVAASILVACADPQAFLPKPYKPRDKGQNRMAQMILPGHIVVPLVRGLDEKIAVLITRAVIDDFVQNETIATTTSPAQRTSRLYGEFVTRPDGASAVRWAFRDPYGDTLDDFEVPAEGLTTMDPGSPSAKLSVKDLARATTTRILAQRRTALVSERLAPRGAPHATGREQFRAREKIDEKIIVTAIFDAPEGGAHLLREAVILSLGEAGFDVTRHPDDKTFRLQCTVGITESRAGFERLALTWELKSPSGLVLATIDQANEIPAGSLADGWAELAPLVTQGAATGIYEFFRKQGSGS